MFVREIKLRVIDKSILAENSAVNYYQSYRDINFSSRASRIESVVLIYIICVCVVYALIVLYRKIEIVEGSRYR